ncbi:MAG: DNA polymerase III subunit alpha [candidate division WOR-3 bacterium]
MSPERQKSDFVHLHTHSEYSLLDGATPIEDMVKLAKDFGMPALALTDHGNMFGAIKFYKAAQKAGIKPIIGAEVYVAPRDRRLKEIRADIPEASFHLTLLCRNETGYYNLIKLVSLAYLEGFYYKPRIDKELLAKYAQGLIGLSGCLKGEVNWHLLREDYEGAMAAAASYQEILGPDNFYLEIMRTGLPDQERIIPKILDLSSTLDIPIVATNDCHYLRPEDALAQDVLLCIQTGKRLKDKDRLRLNSTGFYFRSGAEMQTLFSDIPEATKNSKEIADRCNLLLDIEHRRFHLPAFQPPKEYGDEFEYLAYLARKGMEKRYPHITQSVVQRLEQELAVIQKMGFAGYFLIVRDIIREAKQKGIPVGPGRGSAAGSLVLYCLGVTEIDPLRYGLLFERFLSTERVTLPDVDVDFSDSRRGEIIDYIRKRYGSDSVAQIITFGTMQARQAVRDVGRVLEIPIPEVDQIAKLIPPGLDLKQAAKEIPELNYLINSQPRYQELWSIAQKLEGLSRHASVHASAVVITPKPLLEFVPLYKAPDADLCTQYDMYTLDDIGLLKMDILGLRTLTVIDEAAKLIRTQEPDFSIERIDLDDQRTYQLIQRGETTGLFQLESPGMRDLCKKTHPEKLEHLIALIALYRPGPMDLIPQYVARKNGLEPVEYEHPLLEPFSKETYGILIYQEQVMQAAQVLAGYTLGQADILRRAMAKKKPEEMASLRESFVQGCLKNTGIPPQKAERIFEILEKFAGYGFNKSHAAGYAYLSYLTAFLKANHPVEFIAASLTSEIGDFDKLAKFVKEARRMGITILPPDINMSQVQFAIENGQVRYGLAGLKNIGSAAAEAVVEERAQNGPYQNLLDFLIRTRGKVNRKAIESLIKAGAFDRFETNRQRLLSRLETEMSKAASERLLYKDRQFELFGTDLVTEVNSTEPEVFDESTLSTYEKEAFGFYFSSHPLERYQSAYRALGLISTGQLEGISENTSVMVGGIITARKIRKDKRDREYFIVTIEDFDSSVEVMVFADLLSSCRQLLTIDNLVIVQGKLKVRAGAESSTTPGTPQIWAERMIEFSSISRFVNSIDIEINSDILSDKMLAKIKDVLKEFPGDIAVYLNLVLSDGSKRTFYLKKFPVRLENECLDKLTAIVGIDGLRMKATLPPPPRSNSQNSGI